MGVLGDRRGQAIQIGAVLLFAFLVLAFAGYQAVAVPDQNARVEAAHAEQVADDVVAFRGSVVDAWATGDVRTATVRLGTTYPPRLFAVNPAPPGGTLRTETAGQLAVRRYNAGPGAGPPGDRTTDVDVCGSGPVTTRAVSYVPAYNEYRGAPTITYENTVVYRRYGDDLRFDSDQALVEDETVNLVPIATSYTHAGTGARSIDLMPGGSYTDTVAPGNNGLLNVTFPSGLSAETWNDTLLDDQPHVERVTESGDLVTVSLEGGTEYTVVCRPVGLDRRP